MLCMTSRWTCCKWWTIYFLFLLVQLLVIKKTKQGFVYLRPVCADHKMFQPCTQNSGECVFHIHIFRFPFIYKSTLNKTWKDTINHCDWMVENPQMCQRSCSSKYMIPNVTQIMELKSTSTNNKQSQVKSTNIWNFR